MIWPGLPETSCDAGAGQVMSPQNKLHYLWGPVQDDYAGLWLKTTFRMMIAEHNQVSGPLSTGPFVGL